MFQELESEGGRGDSRAMKPPGGDSSNLFGSPEEAVPTSRPNRMASNIFGPTEEPQNIPKRTNPPGGKGSGIFDELTPVHTRQRQNPPGGKTSDIFGSPLASTSPLAHPNKPKKLAYIRTEMETYKELSEKESGGWESIDKAACLDCLVAASLLPVQSRTGSRRGPLDGH